MRQEGHRLRRLRPLRLEREEGVALLLVWTAMHRIDAESPLHGLDQAALERLNAELVVAFSGIDATLERPLHAEASWPTDRIRFGACFADMVSLPDNRGERRIDWSVFDQIRPCPSSTGLARLTSHRYGNRHSSGPPSPEKRRTLNLRGGPVANPGPALHQSPAREHPSRCAQRRCANDATHTR